MEGDGVHEHDEEEHHVAHDEVLGRDEHDQGDARDSDADQVMRDPGAVFIGCPASEQHHYEAQT